MMMMYGISDIPIPVRYNYTKTLNEAVYHYVFSVTENTFSRLFLVEFRDYGHEIPVYFMRRFLTVYVTKRM